MNPFVFAMRRPLTMMVLAAAVALSSVLALTRMAIDIFPNLNLPVICVAQPDGGMTPPGWRGCPPMITSTASCTSPGSTMSRAATSRASR